MNFFEDTFPELCVLCTSLSKADFDTGEDAKWLDNSIKI